MSLNENSHIVSNFFDEEKIDKKPIRDGYGEGLVEVGSKNEKVVVLSADLKKSTRCHLFAKKFPERFFEIGVAEQNLATIASGLGVSDMIPFISSFAVFSPGRNWEQIRTTISYNDSNVKIAGHHAGVLTGEDGFTHQALEDIATMRVIPNMKVIVPADAIEAKKAVIASADIWGPVYIRLSRTETPVFTTEKTPFVPNKAQILWKTDKPDVVVIACGYLVYNSLKAAKELEDEGVNVDVINCHTVKPLDRDTILSEVEKAGAVVTVEDHNIRGGLGGAVAELLAEELPTPIEFVGVSDMFTESGKPKELVKKYGMDVLSIKEKIKKVKKRK
jgi:transketolase